MKPKPALAARWATTASAAALVLNLGCSKQEAPPPAPTPPPAAAPQARTPPAPAPQPVAEDTANDVDASLAQVDTRVQTGDYESAVDILLRAQLAQQRMTADQRAVHYNRMRQVQQQIADAMASGDPNAQRAARLLMQYNRMQTRGAGR